MISPEFWCIRKHSNTASTKWLICTKTSTLMLLLQSNHADVFSLLRLLNVSAFRAYLFERRASYREKRIAANTALSMALQKLKRMLMTLKLVRNICLLTILSQQVERLPL